MSDQVIQRDNIFYLVRPSKTEVVMTVLRDANGSVQVAFPDAEASFSNILLLMELQATIRSEIDTQGLNLLNQEREAIGLPPRTIMEATRPTKKRRARPRNVVAFPVNRASFV